MTTLDFTSTSADGLRHADDPLISISTIVANLGSHPVVTFPLVAGDIPDVDWAWEYLEEPADFFGITMPPREELRSACQPFMASAATGRSLLAVTIMLIEAGGRAQFVITGTPTRWFDPTPVRIATSSDVPWAGPNATDPQWRRMAARTTSRGEVDQLRRWLSGNGFVDLVHRRDESSIGSPALGALVFEHEGRLTSLDDPSPVSVLELMQRCGAVRAGTATGHTEFDGLEDASAAWWLSPHFEVHPVEQIGDAQYAVEMSVPPTFLRRPS